MKFIQILFKSHNARPPTLGFRVRVSVTPQSVHGGRIGVWADFSLGFLCFPLPQISFYHFLHPHIIHSVYLISSALVLVWQDWSAYILVQANFIHIGQFTPAGSSYTIVVPHRRKDATAHHFQRKRLLQDVTVSVIECMLK